MVNLADTAAAVAGENPGGGMSAGGIKYFLRIMATKAISDFVLGGGGGGRVAARGYRCDGEVLSLLGYSHSFNDRFFKDVSQSGTFSFWDKSTIFCEMPFLGCVHHAVHIL